ncbi:DNA mismatch repair protein MutS [Thermus sp. PS18]|uniref:MutS-related protein n=1 Tax=Thermus sp. PS18 TaxID=2849039 RepID=UPI002264FDD5|nr:DNA mismatch repair protein MutS [Thermus sp. PS18]UZX14665.1 DNA mismatch repair protein MutS [Thermus sp. PS18]
MRVGLLHPDEDLSLAKPLPYSWAEVEHDLGLGTVLEAMAEGDTYLLDVARQVLAQGLSQEARVIHHRQEVLREALEHPRLIEALYRLAGQTLQEKRKESWGLFRRDRPDLYGGIKAMEALLKGLRGVRELLESAHLATRGFRSLKDQLAAHLTPEFFREAEGHLRALRFPQGIWMTASLGPGGRSRDYTLLLPKRNPIPWPFGSRPKAFTLTLHPRDEAGARILGEFRERGVFAAARALALAVEEVTRFFEALRAEVGFLLGAIRLANRLRALGLPLAFPVPAEGVRLAFRNLYDVGLALRQGYAVGNHLEAHGKNPILITGANRGGKTTFLRSLGLAQIMMQAGLFVGAEFFESGLVDGLFTHFKREEDPSLEAGRFEEELRRLSDLVDHLTARPLFLFNESFAATSEPEGSELGAQVIQALVERGIRVVFVTHFYTLAAAFLGNAKALFLRAERLPDGRRTYRLKEAPPEPTAYGLDLLRRIFG